MEKLKASGKRASWFAKVDDEELPCLHEHWWSGKSGYNDPITRPGTKQADDLIAAIREKGRVILQLDEPYVEGQALNRAGYVGVFEVANVDFDERGLRLAFAKKLFDLK